MALPISEELLRDMSVMVLNYKNVCKHLGLTDEQMRSVNAGDWIIDFIKQIQTQALIEKSIRLNAKTNTSVEAYHSPIAMPETATVEPQGTPE